MITLVDYGAGNVRSVINALERLGATVRIARDGAALAGAERVVFPGVGSFGSMMQTLAERGFVAPLRAHLIAGRPFLGICLGLQALFSESEEAPGVPGLGIFPGRVRRFTVAQSVPHIGWNGLRARQPSPLFAGLGGDEKVYFVHSYHVVPDDPSLVLTTTDYGAPFVSSIQRGAVVATQFHPEKSGPVGLRMLQGFLAGGAPSPLPVPTPGPTRLAKRLIACLDVREDDAGELVVTKGDQYDVRESGAVRALGHPVALARRYYEEGADELTFLNITGFRRSPLRDRPLLEVLRRTSRDVFVPLTIGGGIRATTDAEGRTWSALEVAGEYFRSGADKISLGSDAVAIVEAYLARGEATGQSAIETIARVYGSQAVVVSVDPRRVYVPAPEAAPPGVLTLPTAIPGPRGERHCWYECTIRGGREGRPVDAVTLAAACERLGAGELLLNCIDRDGTNAGFDLELIAAVRRAVTIPIIASSGAGAVEHFGEVFAAAEVEAVLAAGIFHRREVPIAAVKAHLAERFEIRPNAP